MQKFCPENLWEELHLTGKNRRSEGTMEEKRNGQEATTITLELTVDELLYIQRRICIPTPYCWGGYEWEKKIETAVIEKLDTAYQKPFMTREELDHELEKVRERVRAAGLAFENYIVAAEKYEKEFYFSVEDSDEEVYEDYDSEY